MRDWSRIFSMTGFLFPSLRSGKFLDQAVK
jgi:hypothetical protein